MVSGRLVSLLVFFRVTRSAKSESFSTFHGSSKPGNRSFGRFSRPLLEGYFNNLIQTCNKGKSLVVAEIFCYFKGFCRLYSCFCLLDQKYKRGLLQAIFDDSTIDLFGEVEHSKFVKLSDIMNFQNGINADSSKYGYGKKYISVSDILKNDFITYERIVGLINIDDITLEKYSVTYGDVLFQRSSETREDAGRSNVYLDSVHTATFGGFVIRGKKKADYNPLYLKYALDSLSVRKQIMKCAAGAQHINVSQDDLSNVIVNLPGMKIQKDIADFISHLDSRINSISNQNIQYQTLRTALLQQLFI